MKKVLLLVLMLLPFVSSLKMNARDADYRPMLKVGKVWSLNYISSFGSYNICLSIVGDTIVDGEQCYRTASLMTDLGSGKIISQSVGGAFLEKDRKVYRKIGNVWQLLYDFTLQKGDVRNLGNYTKQEVIATDEIFVNGEAYQRLTLKESYDYNGDSATAIGYWVEGIGSSRGFLNPSDWTALGTYGSHLASCYEDGECIFTADDFQVSTVNSGKVTINGLNYYLFYEPYRAVIDDRNTWTGELNIPSEVEFYDMSYVVDGMIWSAFKDCATLTKVRIPQTVTLLINNVLSDDPAFCGSASPDNKNPFNGCTALESIEVDEQNPSMRSIDGVLFNKDATCLYCYPAGIKAESYTVPESVNWIGANAFARCSYLKTIDMPESVTSISGFAFTGCALDTLIIRGVMDSLCVNPYLFGGLNESAKVYVPSMEVDRIKAVYSGTVLPLESYADPTGISQVTDMPVISPAFDLQGRRLNAEPKHGAYIRNGKKVVK